jgi:hypothetical protein
MTLPLSAYRVTQKRKPRTPKLDVVQPEDLRVRLIPLTKGHAVKVSAPRYDFLNQWHWCVYWNKCTRSFYARMGHGGPMMHSMILDLKPGEYADHINHDTLDNTDDNLRKATRSQNTINRRVFSNNKSGHPGVCWHSRDKEWSVYINVNGRRLSLGTFPSTQKDQAIAARKAAEEQYFGEFACNVHPSG